MKKGILFVALLVTVVLAVAPLITGDSVAARSGTLVRTLTDPDDLDNSCVIELYADYYNEEVSGTVTTYTDAAFMTYTRAFVTFSSSSPNDYAGYWIADAYWDEGSDYVQVDSREWGGDTWTGWVKVNWEVWYECGLECPAVGGWKKYGEIKWYHYSYGSWLDADSGIEGTVYDADTGYPISQALVKAYQGTQLMGSDTSAQDGQYQFDVPPGTYKVKASRAGYYNKTYYGVEVDEHGYTTRNIQLEPTGFPIPI